MKYKSNSKTIKIQTAIDIINNFNIDNTPLLKVKLVDNILSRFQTFNKRSILLNNIIMHVCVKRDLHLLNYLITNFTANELGNAYFYQNVKNSFDNNIPVVKSALYLSNWHF